MGIFDSLFGGGLYSITDNDTQRMTAHKGYVRYAFRYLGGHSKFPRIFECVAELSAEETSNPILNIYSNNSAAGILVDPDNYCFSVKLKNIKKIEHGNKSEFSGAILVGGFGAVLNETRFLVYLEYLDEEGTFQKIGFGTTPAIKS